MSVSLFGLFYVRSSSRAHLFGQGITRFVKLPQLQQSRFKGGLCYVAHSVPTGTHTLVARKRRIRNIPPGDLYAFQI